MVNLNLPYQFSGNLGSDEYTPSSFEYGLYLLLTPGKPNPGCMEDVTNLEFCPVQQIPRLYNVYYHPTEGRFEDRRTLKMSVHTRASLILFLHLVRHWYPMLHRTTATCKVVVERREGGGCCHALLAGPFYPFHEEVQHCPLTFDLFKEFIKPYHQNLWGYFQPTRCQNPRATLYDHFSFVELSKDFLNRAVRGTEDLIPHPRPKKGKKARVDLPLQRLVYQIVDTSAYTSTYYSIRLKELVLPDGPDSEHLDLAFGTYEEQIEEYENECDQYRKIVRKSEREDRTAYSIKQCFDEHYDAHQQSIKAFFAPRSKCM